MKLRNKITGKICDAEAREDGIYLKADWGDGEKWHKYGLGCLGDNYEYYAEPKEPYIGDEQIRKCVRLWAEINEFKGKLMYSKSDDYCSFYEADSQEELLFLNRECPNLKHAVKYTIAELCGDSKEDEDEA